MDKVYKLSDAAVLLGIKPRTLRQWIKDKKIRAFKYPNAKNWYISSEDIAKRRKMIEKNI